VNRSVRAPSPLSFIKAKTEIDCVGSECLSAKVANLVPACYPPIGLQAIGSPVSRELCRCDLCRAADADNHNDFLDCIDYDADISL